METIPTVLACKVSTAGLSSQAQHVNHGTDCSHGHSALNLTLWNFNIAMENVHL